MDFTFLISISNGDQEFISEFISTFEEMTIVQITEMIALQEKGDFVRLGQLAHQVKPTTEMLGFETQNNVVLINKAPQDATKEMLEGILKEAKEALITLKEKFST